MKAEYSGYCCRCGMRFYPGAEIVPYHNKWRVANCHGCKLLDLEQNAVKAMLEKFNIAQGPWQHRDAHTQSTYTRAEWGEKCVELGVLTQSDFDRLMAWWGIRLTYGCIFDKNEYPDIPSDAPGVG